MSTGRRSIRFGESHLAIAGKDETSWQLIDALFGDVFCSTTNDPDDTEGHVQFSVEYRSDTQSFHCFHEDFPIYVGQNKGNLARRLMDKVVYCLADTSRGGLMLHAGALEYDNKVLLIPGKSGAGKSTLISWLAYNGFRYLTDELVYIRTDPPHLEAFTRPVNIKTRGLGAIRSFIDLEAHSHELIQGGFATLIPHRLFNSDTRRTNAAANLILFPEYSADSTLEITRLSQAATAARLMGMLINARNLADHGFPETTRLATSAPGFALEYSEFDGVVDRIAGLLANTS